MVIGCFDLVPGLADLKNRDGLFRLFRRRSSIHWPPFSRGGHVPDSTLSPDKSLCSQTLQELIVLERAATEFHHGLVAFHDEASAEKEFDVSSVRIFRQLLVSLIHRTDAILCNCRDVDHADETGQLTRFFLLVRAAHDQLSAILPIVNPATGTQVVSPSIAIEKSFKQLVAVVAQEKPKFKAIAEEIEELLKEKRELVSTFSQQAAEIERRFAGKSKLSA